MYFDGWLKLMFHFSSICCSSPLKPQVLFYDIHNSHFDGMALDILWYHYMKSFILNSGEYVHGQLSSNGPNLNINISHGD